jgi:hypothetical protein
MRDLDALISEAGRTHVIPPREDPALLGRLNDPLVLARARELLASGDSGTRRQAILCIERIGFSRQDQETAELLLQHASTTPDKYEAMTSLDGLTNLTPPQPLPSEPLLRLARRREWQVWRAAVRCLHLAPPSEAEPVLLERLSTGAEGLVYVARELRYMRSAESLRALDDLLEHERLDVRCVALDSLGERLGAGVVPYARRLATAKQWQAKYWAEKWLSAFGDEDDLTFMTDRVRRLVSGRRTAQRGPPEVSYLVPFILRHEAAPAARAAQNALRRHVDRLPENERSWLETNLPQVLKPE